MDRAEAVGLVLDELASDRMIAFSDGIPNFLASDPVVLLTGFRSMSASAVSLARKGTGLLAVTPEWDATRARAATHEQLIVVGRDELASAVGDLVHEARRVAVVNLDQIDEPTRAELERSGVELISADGALQRRTGAKTATEIARARRAADLAEVAYRQLLDMIEVGVAEFELIAELDASLARAGADDNFVLMSSGPIGGPLRQPTGRRLELGDVVGIEISPCIEGQFAQVCRTIVLGEASNDQRADYALLAAAFTAAVGSACAGASASSVAAAADEPIVAAGYGDYCRPPYMRVRGHGLGLSTVSPGGLSRDNHTLLERDMLFVIHPNQHLPRSGYLLCGGPVLIHDTFAEPLVEWEPKLDEVTT